MEDIEVDKLSLIIGLAHRFARRLGLSIYTRLSQNVKKMGLFVK